MKIGRHIVADPANEHNLHHTMILSHVTVNFFSRIFASFSQKLLGNQQCKCEQGNPIRELLLTVLHCARQPDQFDHPWPPLFLTTSPHPLLPPSKKIKVFILHLLSRHFSPVERIIFAYGEDYNYYTGHPEENYLPVEKITGTL